MYIPEVWNSLIVAWNPNSPSKPCRQNANHTKCDFWIFAPFSDWDPKDSYHSCCISNILHDSDCFHINLASLEKVEFYLKKRVLLFSFKNHRFMTHSEIQPFKVVKILKGRLDSIPSPSPLVKIQIMGGKVCLRCKDKTLLGIVNKLLKKKSLLTSPSKVLPYYLM